jgi:hypothetical protein
VACPNHAAVRAVRPLAGHASPSGEGCPATAGRVDRPGCACDSGRALVKHAGLAPREKLSGAFVGRTKLTGQGRPGLRLAAWRAARAARLSNPIYAARYRHLTTAEHNKLRPTQAQPVLAAAILRHLHAVITTGQTWDPAIAAQPNTTRTSRRRPTGGRRTSSSPSGRALHGIKTHVISTTIMGSPARRLTNPITRCRDQPHSATQGQTTDQGTRPTA